MPMRGPRATSVGWLALGLIVLALAVPGGSLAASGSPSSNAPLPAPSLARAPLTVPLAAVGAGAPLGAVESSQFIGLGIVLQPTSSSQVGRLIQEQQTPGSPAYHHYLSPQQYHSLFDPSPAQVSAVQRYFQSYGFSWTPSGPGSYELTGTVGAADLAFRTTLLSYATANGRHAWAPSVEPTLPSTIASVVGSVAGLNNFGSPHPNFVLPSILSPSHLQEAKRAAAQAPSSPRATITLAFSSTFFSLYGGVQPLFAPPVGMNVSITATVTGGGTPTGPCTWSWTFGDGASNSSTNDPNCASDTVTHEYIAPANQFWPVPSWQIVVNFADSAGNSGTYNATVIPSMSSQWMQKFYAETGLLTHGSSGAGTTIGLDEMCDPSYDNGTSLYTTEVNVFSAVMGLPALTVNYVGDPSVVGSPTSCYPQWGISGWAGETLLDMEWAHAMAPNATLEVYFGVDGPNLPWENYMDIDGGDVLWANNLGDSVFLASNSWGIDESTGAYSLFHQTWAQAAAEGLSLFASTGDCGATDGTAGLNVSWPASDPYGVAVGGTILHMNNEGQFLGEYVWNGTYSTATCQNNEGTGGGWSKVFTQPSYQSGMPGNDKGYTPPPVWTIKNPRGLPDISADAATWADVYFSSEWVPTGGTSLASPMWAAMADLMLDAIGYGQRPAGLLNYHIYAVGTTNVTYERDFHDIFAGSNCNLAAGCSLTYSAYSLWDPASGWGSPDVYNLTQNWNNTFPPWYQVSGYVLSSTGGVLAGALVTSGSASATTDATGHYLLYAPKGSLTLTATATGYATGTRGVVVNSTDLADQNITLYPGPTYYVSGTVLTEVGAPVTNGMVVASQGGAAIASAGTNGLGKFVLWAPAGSYTLTASAPYLNSSSTTLNVNGNVLNLIFHLTYPRHTVEGIVLSYVGHVPVWGASVLGATFQAGSAVYSSGNTTNVGQFFLHLPIGSGSISASDYPYLPNTSALQVWQQGTYGITIFLYPDGARTTQVDLALKILDPVRTPQGLPTLATGNSLTIEIWANNSLTHLPQLGIYLFFSDQYLGKFSSVNVSVGLGGPGNAPAGFAEVNYTAPWLASAVSDELVVEVGNPGWSGSALTTLYLTPNFATTCAASGCTYTVWGVVVSTSGARLPGAQVTIQEGLKCGSPTVATGTSNSNGIYSEQLSNNTYSQPYYYAVASLSGYSNPNPGTCTQFVVNGTPEEVDLVLQPNAPPLTPAEQNAYKSYRNLFSVDGWAIIPLLALAMILITVAAWRLVRKDEDEKDEKGSQPHQAPPEQQIFPGAGGSPQALPPGPPGGPQAPPPVSEAPPPETPWEITPAPAPPPPDTGSPPLPGSMDDVPPSPESSPADYGGDNGGDMGGAPPPPLP